MHVPSNTHFRPRVRIDGRHRHHPLTLLALTALVAAATFALLAATGTGSASAAWQPQPPVPLERPGLQNHLVTDSEGVSTLVWLRSTLDAGENTAVMAMRIDPSGEPLGPPVEVSGEFEYGRVGQPTIHAGTVTISWARDVEGAPDDVVESRQIDPSGNLAPEVLELGDACVCSGNPASAAATDGTVLVAWLAPGMGTISRQLIYPDGSLGSEIVNITGQEDVRWLTVQAVPAGPRIGQFLAS